MKHLQTYEKTLNKKVKTLVKQMVPFVAKTIKRHVPGCGYVYFLKDNDGKTIAHISKEYKGIMITVK